MMIIAAFESVFGSRVGRFIVEFLLVVALLAGAVLYLEHRGATQELAKLQVSSAKVIARAQKQITQDTADYAAAQKSNQEKLNAATAANTALQSDLNQRVRDFAAYRASHPDLARPAGSSGAASAGECGARSCGELAQELAERGTELAGAAGAASAALESCQRDRDSLTGKP